MLQSMGETMALQQRLAEEFNTENIGLKVTNNSHLALTFQNSPMANLPESEQALKAREVALYVRDHYDGYNSLSTISVLFIQHNRYGPLKVTKTQAAFSFQTSELGSKTPQA
jgi:hypothetical protein